jgi:hypothetical protein
MREVRLVLGTGEPPQPRHALVPQHGRVDAELVVQRRRPRGGVGQDVALPSPRAVDEERPRAQRHDPVVVRPLDHERLHERRVRLAREATVVGLEVVELRARVAEREPLDGSPLVLLHTPPVLGAPDGPAHGARCDRAVDERDRIERSLAEPAVGQIALPVDVDDERHVVGQLAAGDVRDAALDGEARGDEQVVEHGVDLEAVAAAAAGEDALEEGARVQRLALAELDRQGLVGHRPDVGAVQLAQAVDVRGGHRGEPDACEERLHGARMP